MLLTKEQEYKRRRQKDAEKTRKVEQFIDEVYSANGFAVERVSDAGLQKRGVDIIWMEM